jgi:hypothetical protein
VKLSIIGLADPIEQGSLLAAPAERYSAPAIRRGIERQKRPTTRADTTDK